MISLTVFKTIFDNSTDVKVIYDTYEEFEAALYKLSTMAGKKLGRGEHILRSMKLTPLISPAVYKKGATRANANVIKWGGWAALDVDNHFDDNHKFTGDLKSELHDKFGEYDYICYSTASSTLEKPKFRLVFRLTKELDAKHIPHFWYALNKEFNDMGDEQTKDCARLFYAPAAYPNAYNFIFSNRGKEIDPHELMVKHPWTDPNMPLSREDLFDAASKRRMTKDGVSVNYTWTSYKDCKFVNKTMVEEYTLKSHIDGSGRYSMIYKIMCSIAKSALIHGYNINEYEIVDLVRQLDRETSNRYAKRPLNVEARRALRWANANL